MTPPVQPAPTTPPPLTLERMLSLRAALPGKVSTELLVGFPCEGQVSLVWWDRTVESLRPDEHHLEGFDYKIIHDEGETDSPIWQFFAQTLRITALAEAQAEENKRLREALEWYANEKNYLDDTGAAGEQAYSQWPGERIRTLTFHPDRGERARAALAPAGAGEAS